MDRRSHGRQCVAEAAEGEHPGVWVWVWVQDICLCFYGGLVEPRDGKSPPQSCRQMSSISSISVFIRASIANVSASPGSIAFCTCVFLLSPIANHSTKPYGCLQLGILSENSDGVRFSILQLHRI